ncbi:MAG: hypothetical protein IKX06_01545 [Clostridia bacterium]|nr:hypothetical protein [Clostridia bacterium]
MIREIIAEKDRIVFYCSESSGRVIVRAYSPALSEEKLLGTAEREIEDGSFSLERHLFGRDGAFLRYETDAGGVKYCSEVYSRCQIGYPETNTVKGLQISDPEDAEVLGVRHTAINVAINNVLLSGPGPCTEEYDCDGGKYYINMEMIRHYDRIFREFTEKGIVVTLILLCGKNWWGMPIQEEMKKVLLHPDYDDEGTLSAFNVATDEGIRHYRAFVTYLAERYGGDVCGGHGNIHGMIVSNEVTSQWIWGNAGLKTVEEYASIYLTSMRIAYLAAQSVSSDIRIYASLDHFWNASMNENEPLKFYSGKALLGAVRELAKEQGDLYYNIAYHPYPEDLSKPDFWNDVTATDDDDTVRITFKNLQVLARYIYKDENLYKGRKRRIILSEQGFNSKWTPESEILQATAYGRAYRKVMEIPEIDAFILHAHLDNKDEFGLNLGIWRRKPDSNEKDAPKPIYYLFKVIDQKDDTGRFVWERF